MRKLTLKRVVLYLHSTSNHNHDHVEIDAQELYYIFILHQTTTWTCFVLAFILLYYIFILHQTTTGEHPRQARARCIISSFYIKPQLLQLFKICLISCIISSFYIKPQPTYFIFYSLNCCIISSFYIKPQLFLLTAFLHSVVLYLHSTSNHNPMPSVVNEYAVVLYLHSTSNHNPFVVHLPYLALYYIFILHQTTTRNLRFLRSPWLYYIFILHQTTTLW